MAANRPDFVNQTLEMWGRLEWRQRITIIAFAALGVILIVSVVYFANRVEYQTLYRDLNPEDAQAITAKLKEERRDFRVQGTSILVAAPKEDIDRMRLEFSGAGLGRSGLIGYEIFDKNQFGMTDFTERINLQRATEGELARTISRLSEVSTARVHIVLPKDSYFEESREPAKASVVLSLKMRGARLSSSSIEGIKGVVAGAVPGLSPQNVSIVDDEGRVLFMESEDMARSEREIEMKMREQMEKELAAKAIDALEPILGRENVRANASVEINTSTVQQTDEMFDPNPPAIVSQQRIQERAGGNILDAGIPGTQSNVAMTDSTLALVTGPERMRESATTNYEISKITRQTVQPKGSIRKLSVGVTLNQRQVVSKGQDGTVTTRMESIPREELDEYRDLVRAAVGYDELRGDVVTIVSAQFFDENALRDARPAGPWYQRVQKNEFFLPSIKYIALLLVFALIYLIFVHPLRKRVIKAIEDSAPELPPAEENLLLESGEAPVEALPPSSEENVEALPEGLPDVIPEPEIEEFDMENATDEQIEDMLTGEEMAMGKGARRYAVIKKMMIDKARRNPELASQLIRSMMQEKA